MRRALTDGFLWSVQFDAYLQVYETWNGGIAYSTSLWLGAPGHPRPRAPGSPFRHPWLHGAPKALQQHPHPMSQPTAWFVVTGMVPSISESNPVELKGS